MCYLTRNFESLHMKTLIVLLSILFNASIAEAQHFKLALEKARTIEFLKDGRDEALRKLSDFALTNSDDSSDDLELGDTRIEVFYSSGECKSYDDDDEDNEIWQVKNGRVVRMEITERTDISQNELEIDLAKFEKEQKYAENEEDLIYHQKANGIAVEISDELLDKVILFPRVTKNAQVCKNKYAKEFASHKSWFGSKKLEDRTGIICINIHANVTALELDIDELLNLNRKNIAVTTTAVDPENDPLVYVYVVSAGKVIGSGAKVTWDLSGFGPGKYTITAGVDDGCGLCGETRTRTVTIK